MILYGTSRSRASRSLWALEELGLAYEHRPLAPGPQLRSAEYLLINPNARIPALDDGGLILWESLAINLYLAARYGRAPFWPAAEEQRARATMWSFWSQTEIEQPLLALLAARGRSDGEQSRARLGAIERALGVLDDHLQDRDCLLGSEFTIADLNLASVIREPHETGVSGLSEIETGPFGSFNRWMDRCAARPAHARVRALA